MLFLPDTNRLIVTDGDENNGAVELVNGADYKIIDKIKLPNDVDGAIFNPVRTRIITWKAVAAKPAGRHT